MIKRSRIDTDTDRNTALTCRRNNLLDALRATNVAGIDAQRRNSLCHCLKRKLIVEMNIRNERRFYLTNDITEIFRCLHIRYCQANNITPCRCKLPNLLDG